MANSRHGLPRDSHTPSSIFTYLSLHHLEVLDDGHNVIELRIFCRSGVGDSTILEEHVIRLFILMDCKSCITTIFNNKVRTVTLTIILWTYKGIYSALPVVVEDITLPVKHSSRFIICTGSCVMILGRENFAWGPTEVTAKVLESLNQHCCMDGHV